LEKENVRKIRFEVINLREVLKMVTGFNVLTKEDLMQKASSVFAEAPLSRVSKGYKMYPTIKVVDAFEKEGWYPVMASQQRKVEVGKTGFQKHMLRFRQIHDIDNPRDVMAEIVLTNSHDGKAAFNLMAGLFRLVCGNGMVIVDQLINKIRVVHTGTEARDVIEASYRIVENIPNTLGSVHLMKEIELSHSDQSDFAHKAYEIKYGKDKAQFDPMQLLTIRREEDKLCDLFSIFNRVQENMLRGGLKVAKGKGLRPINAINENIKLNVALWALAQSFYELKKSIH
jgi:hypothetical protein